MHGKQLEQWNLQAPVLYLWSHPDWSSRHKAVAQECGHISMEQKGYVLNSSNIEREVSNNLIAENHDNYGDFSTLMNDNVPEDHDRCEPENAGMSFVGRPSNQGSEILKDGFRMEPSIESLKEMEYEGKEDLDRIMTSIEQYGTSETEPEVDGMCIDMEISSPFNSAVDWTDLQSLLESPAYEAVKTPEVEVGKTGSEYRQTRSLLNRLGFKTHYQLPGCINPGVGTSVGASNENKPDGLSSETHTRADLLNRQDHNVLFQDSDSYHLGSTAQSSYPQSNYSFMRQDGP